MSLRGSKAGGMYDEDEWPRPRRPPAGSEAPLEAPTGEAGRSERTRAHWRLAVEAAEAYLSAWRMRRRGQLRRLADVCEAWGNVRSREVVEKALNKAKTEKALDLGGNRLWEIPRLISDADPKVLRGVKRLSLEDNRITRLPRRMFQLFRGVVNMMLYKNRLTCVPPDVGLLKHLQLLILSNNNLQILPPSMGDLENLHTLLLDHNPALERFPLEFGKLKHVSAGGAIKELKYDIDNIIYPPPEISEQGLPLTCEFLNRMWSATYTGRLTISGLSLEYLPEYVCEPPLCTAITELNVFQNSITRYPPEMGYLTNLNILRMDEGTCAFPAQSIVHQNEPFRDAETRQIVGANRLPMMGFLKRVADSKRTRSIVLQGGTWRYGRAEPVIVSLALMAPEVMWSAASCKVLDLSHNDIKDVPASVGHCTALTALHLNNNRIRSLPQELEDATALRVLNLSENELFSVPDAFAQMLALADLDVSVNKIRRLPDSLCACTALTRLMIYTNKMTEAPEGLHTLTRLRFLRLGGNPWEYLPSQLAASPFLIEVNGDNLSELQTTCQSVLHQCVPPRNPVQDYDPGMHRFACNPQRIARVVKTPHVWAFLESLGSGLGEGGAGAGMPEELRFAVEPFVGIEERTPHEMRCWSERQFVVYEPADTIYSRKWKLSKEAQLRGLDPIVVNQSVAASMPHMARSPGLVRYMWGLWGGSAVGVCDLSGTGMCTLRDDVLRMRGLTKLVLAYNKLASLSPQISVLTRLRTIDVSHNRLCALPAEMGALEELCEIIVSYNMLDSLPKEMSNLKKWTYQRDPKAKHLFDITWAEGNPISFPHPQVLQLGASHTRSFLLQVSIGEQTGVLEFEHRELPLFPDQLTDFAFLVSLNLSYNKIDRVPPSITNMVQLRECCLAGNSIDRLPTRLSTLTSLQLLDMRDNQLVALPETIGMLHVSLVRLLLGRNKLSSLPASMGLLTNLQELMLNWNELEELPEETGNCTKLVELQLSYNRLKQIPGSFSNLTSLTSCALQNNRLQLLPTVLGNMPNLQKLAFAHNHWQMPQPEVLSWPKEYTERPELKLSCGMKVMCRFQRFGRFRPARIDADHGDGFYDVSYPYDREAKAGIEREQNMPRIVQFEEGAPEQIIIVPLTDHQRLVDFMNRFHASGKSKDLDLSGFHMTEFLDYDAGYGFKYVNMSGWYTRGLRKLDLSYNLLATLPLSISRLSSLTVLSLANNDLIALPETISSLISLKIVDLSCNHLTVLPCGLGMASEMEQIFVRQNPLLAPPIEMFRQEASAVVKYLRGVLVARKTGKLDWNGLGLMSLDSLVVMLPDGDAALVEELYLDDNLLVVLHPSVLYELQNLQVLRCCRNYLTSVHPNLGTFCKRLEQLTLDGNAFATVPHTLGTLSKLVSVSFDACPHLVSPPAEINEMPSQIKVRYLRELHSAHAHGMANMASFDLSRLPEALTDVWTLRSLNVSGNTLRALPPTVGRWAHIQELDVGNNEISVLEPNLGLCVCMQALRLPGNRVRRLPPELGRLTALTVLDVDSQTTEPSLDCVRGTQGYEWSAFPTPVAHVHNIACLEEEGLFQSGPVEARVPCIPCIEEGRLDAGTFPHKGCVERLQEHQRLERDRAARGEPSKEEPTVQCKVCEAELPVRSLQEFPRLNCAHVRTWLPSVVYHEDTWGPALPASAFAGVYKREIEGRACTDSRPEPDVIETPPLELLHEAGGGKEAGGVRRLVDYLGRCLAGRDGVLDVCGFGLPQFPLEALDLAWLVECRCAHNEIYDVPNDLDRLTHLRMLQLDSNHLCLLPPGVRFLTNLEELSVTDNELVELCPEIGSCTKLRVLSLAGNYLSTLPHTVGNCTNLTQLAIERNEMQVLPPSLSLASNIATLTLDSDKKMNKYWSPPNPVPSFSSHNLLKYLREVYRYPIDLKLSTPGYDLEEMPDLFLEACSSITALNLDENNIHDLPDRLGDFVLLSEIMSICDNQLTKLPSTVGNLTALCRMRLSGNKLASLPIQVSQLTRLVQLTLDHNRLTDIPRHYSTLTCLQELTFVDNDIRHVHPEMGLISSITKLGLQDNPLVVPSHEICLRGTREVIDYLGRIKVSQLSGALDLADIRLTTLQNQLAEACSARAVLLQDNELKGLPDDIDKFSRIQELILDHNPFTVLPPEIGRLNTLQILSIEKMRNGLQRLPNSMDGLYSLVVLKAADNGLEALPNVFKHLKALAYVDLRRNRLTSLPSTFSQCEALEVLLLEDNLLEELCKGTSSFEKLHTLNLRNNKLRRLPRGLGGLRLYHKLKQHDLSGNPWELPNEAIRSQGETRMLEYVGEIWKSKLANCAKVVSFGLFVIPPEILELHNVVELCLDSNNITEIPREIAAMKKLEEVSAMHNRITRICDELFELKSLAVLKMDNNKLTSLNHAIGKVARTLTWLGLERNNIPCLPTEFAQLEGLEIFTISVVTLEPDLQWVMEMGLDVLKSYIRAWGLVPGSNKVVFNWSNTMAWEPLPWVPFQLWKFSETVTHVLFNDNDIRELPQRICTLHALKVLSLDRNNLTSLPYGLCLLTALEAVSLTDNQELHDPPYELVEERSKNLKPLRKYLEGMHLAAALKSLVLTGLNLAYWKPNEVLETTLAKLRWRLARAETKTSDHVMRAPEESSQIRRRLQILELRTISLDDNALTVMPTSVFIFTCLTMLSVAKNQLSTVPPEIGVLSSLTVLHADYNEIDGLPSEIGGLVGMKKLTLSHNNMEFVPEAMLRLTRLQILSVACNKISEIPEALPRTLTHLRVLSINKNTISSLPDSIKYMVHLVALHASDNDIITVPPAIAHCRRLRALYLSNNPLPHLPLGVLKLHELEQLRIAGTLITGLPVNLALLTALKDLNISGTTRLAWPPKEVLEEGLEEIQRYLLDHLELTEMEPIEDEDSAFMDLDYPPVTQDSLLSHEDKVDETLEELSLLRDQAEQLAKIRVKQARMGNKSNVAEIDAQLENISERSQWLASDILQLEEMREVETDLLLVQAELDKLESIERSEMARLESVPGAFI